MQVSAAAESSKLFVHSRPSAVQHLQEPVHKIRFENLFSRSYEFKSLVRPFLVSF